MTENNTGIKRGRKKDTNFPEYVTCKITGKQFKINVTQLRKQLEKRGQSIDEYLETYVCREGRHIQEANADPTPINPVINPDLGTAIEENQINQNDLEKVERRKVMLKDLWNKICQQPPEYYHEKFKLRYQNGRQR